MFRQHFGESASDYSKRLASYTMPTGGRHVKIAKSAAFRHRPKKLEPSPVRVYRGDAVRKFNIPNPFKRRHRK